MVLWGGPLGRSFTKKKSSPLRTPLFHPVLWCTRVGIPSLHHVCGTQSRGGCPSTHVAEHKGGKIVPPSSAAIAVHRCGDTIPPPYVAVHKAGELSLPVLRCTGKHSPSALRSCTGADAPLVSLVPTSLARPRANGTSGAEAKSPLRAVGKATARTRRASHDERGVTLRCWGLAWGRSVTGLGCASPMARPAGQ